MRFQLSPGDRPFQPPGEKLTAVIKRPARESVTVNLVVDAEKIDHAAPFERAVRGDFRRGPDLEQVVGGRHQRRTAQHIALRLGDHVTHIGQCGGEQFGGGLIRRVHQDIMARRVFDRDDRVVEIVVGNLVVLRVSGHEEHRIRLESGQFEHRNQQRRLVAADSVALVEGHRNVVRLVTRRLGLGGDAHVADLL
ncbi:hypothetical protein SDC9_143929 [bioreactor metagenome]|uniref:Uncharacterized protein n=1 Tax=bioreactor metagenome TaxID=1076179 RepID=A0A645E4Q9_9ZZZZ